MSARVTLLLLACVGLASFAPAAHAASGPSYAYDITDPQGDADGTGSAADAASADLVRLQTHVDGDSLVEVLTMAGARPDTLANGDSFWVHLTNDVTASSHLFVQYEVDSDGSRTTTQLDGTGPAGKLAVTVENTTGSSLTFRWPLSAMASATCFSPSAEVGMDRGLHPDVKTEEDTLGAVPNVCANPDANTDGFDGTCPDASAPAGYAQTVKGGGNVQDASLRIDSFSSAIQGTRATDTVTLGAPPASGEELTLKHQIEKHDATDFTTQPRSFGIDIKFGDAGYTAAVFSGSIPVFPVSVSVEGAKVTASWCVSAMPDVTCHAIGAQATSKSGGEVDTATYGLGQDPCNPLPGDEGGSGAASTPSTDGSPAAASPSGGEKKSPLVEPVIVLAALAGLAVATRRPKP